MFIANIFVVILIYALILSTLTIDKDVLYHVYGCQKYPYPRVSADKNSQWVGNKY